MYRGHLRHFSTHGIDPFNVSNKISLSTVSIVSSVSRNPYIATVSGVVSHTRHSREVSHSGGARRFLCKKGPRPSVLPGDAGFRRLWPEPGQGNTSTQYIPRGGRSRSVRPSKAVVGSSRLVEVGRAVQKTSRPVRSTAGWLHWERMLKGPRIVDGLDECHYKIDG